MFSVSAPSTYDNLSLKSC